MSSSKPVTSLLADLIASQGWALADGATGTELFNMGLMSGDAPELWNEEHPDRITKLYTNAVDAGCDIFLTNSFGGNASRLKLHGAQDRAFELSKLAAEIGREVADRQSRTVIVAGCIGPTGEIMAPIGPLTHDTAVEMFHEQAQGLKEGGADLLWVETLSAPEELKAAAEAARLCDMPWACTMSFDTAGRTMMGLTAPDLTALVSRFKHKPVAYGANCGVGSSDLLRTVKGFGESEINIIAKGNAGIPKYHDGHIHYDGTPDLMADYACLARDAGARIIGGCCGTTPEHLKAMRAALESRPKKSVPTDEEIANALGGFSSEDDGTGPATVTSSKRRNRRRSSVSG